MNAYTSVDQIIRKRGRYYEIVAADLKDFFSKYGEYRTIYEDHNALRECCGSNAYNWEIVEQGSKESVHLSLLDDPTFCAVPVDILLEVVDLIGDSRFK